MKKNVTISDVRDLSIIENAALIDKLIAGEHKLWIPEKGVENFNFKWSQHWDLYWWYLKDKDFNYLYLDRPDWFKVTLQRSLHHLEEWYKVYWNVYVCKEITDPWCARHNQEVEHKFRWVRSLKHAMKLWEFAWELMLGLSDYSEYFLSDDELNSILNP